MLYRQRSLDQVEVCSDCRSGDCSRHTLVRCGRCPDCELARRRDWGARMMHEARDHDRSSFLTLTYDERHLPADYGLDKRHLQLFLKRLRKRLDVPVRYFACGEYGGRTLRPHYHLILYGTDFSEDRVLKRHTDAGDPLYESPTLSAAWNQGEALIGRFSFDSAAYVAKYVQKGDSRNSCRRVDPITGEVWYVAPQFATMSRRPGIGRSFYERFRDDLAEHDSVVVKGQEVALPAYYSRLLREGHPEVYADVLASRRKAAFARAAGQDPHYHRQRLRAREQVVLSRSSTTERGTM